MKDKRYKMEFTLIADAEAIERIRAERRMSLREVGNYIKANAQIECERWLDTFTEVSDDDRT
jgi:hypothetical protein